jgi:hypothetical protein
MGYARHLGDSQSPLWGGSFAMKSVAGFAWNQWQLCRGMIGSFGMESVAGFAWNRWQLCHGISGRLAVESVAGFARNTQRPSGIPLHFL